MTMNTRRRTLLFALAALPLARGLHAQTGFDHTHRAWSALLKKHVVVLRGGLVGQQLVLDHARTVHDAVNATMTSVEVAQQNKN